MTAARFLSILILALGATLAWVWVVPSTAWVPPRPILPEVPEIHAEAGAAVPRSSEQLLSRPVFWASRRAVTGPAEPPPLGLVENVQLLGLLGQGEQSAVIIRFQDKVMRLTRGKMVAGWRFQGVEGGDAVFSRSDERQHIPMVKKFVQELPRRGAAARPAAVDAQ